ncbi:MAG: type II secretion system F family protein [Methanobacterium sp.]|nr:type II secretion system F family protein [Methanobacterium sp.]
MVFKGLKNFFNRIGWVTLDSTKKLGKGVIVPLELSKIRSKREKFSQGFKKVSFNKINVKRTSQSLTNRRLDKNEIEIFNELIDKKYNKVLKFATEKKVKKDVYQKTSLEELLKIDEKQDLEPRMILVIGGISFIIVFMFMLILGFGIIMGIIFGLIIILITLVLFFLPNIKRGSRSNQASRELPFALRQMATELSAGIGIHDSMRSVALSGYGPLSEEFARALEEIKYGETTEKALIDMGDRIDSDGLKRAVYQITRTLSSGGDIAKTLNVIAEDTSYELRMKLKDYSQKLNSFTMLYMFIAILAPVITMIMLLAASTVMGALISPILLIIIYLFLFPLIVGFLAFMIKRFEPQI